MSMMVEVFIAVLIMIVHAHAQDYTHINCDLQNERNDIYVSENAWYECDGDKEVLRFCIICDEYSTKTRGQYITRAVLLNLKKSKRSYQSDEEFCNSLKSKSCGAVKKSIGEWRNIHNFNSFRPKSPFAHFRRYDGHEVKEY